MTIKDGIKLGIGLVIGRNVCTIISNTLRECIAMKGVLFKGFDEILKEKMMKNYLEKRDKKTNDILAAMKKLRDSEIENNGANAELFTEVVSELSYRITKDPDDHKLCPNCETPIPKAEYDHYCGFCGQFIRK